jgi:hypothetical protein
MAKAKTKTFVVVIRHVRFIVGVVGVKVTFRRRVRVRYRVRVRVRVGVTG